MLVPGLSLVAPAALAQPEALTVEETIATLQGGVTNPPLEAALANLEDWQTTPEASDDGVRPWHAARRPS